MATYDDISTGRLVYTCNCGWVEEFLAPELASARAAVACSGVYHRQWTNLDSRGGNGPEKLSVTWGRAPLAQREAVALSIFHVTYRQDMGIHPRDRVGDGHERRPRLQPDRLLPRGPLV